MANIFGSNLFIIIEASLFILVIVFLSAAYFANIKSKARSRIKETKHVFDKILLSIKRIVVPIETSRKYKYYLLKLREAGTSTNLTVESFYTLKILVPVILIIPLLMITQLQIEKHNISIIREVDISLTSYLSNVTDNNREVTEEKNIKKLLEDDNERYYTIVKSTIRNINRATIQQIQNVLLRKTDLNSEDATKKAESIKSKTNRLFDSTILFLVGLLVLILGYQIPNMVLHIIHSYRALRRETEKMLIQEMVINLGYLNGIKVFDILNKLVESTRIYKYLFKNCLTDMENGLRVEAFCNLKNNTSDQDIIDLADFFIVCLEKGDMKEKTSTYENEQQQKKEEFIAMEEIKYEKVMTYINILITLSMFFIVFGFLLSMSSLLKNI